MSNFLKDILITSLTAANNEHTINILNQRTWNNYWKLSLKLLDDGVENKIVRVLSVWYSKQSCYVKWQNVVSREFSMSNGIREGGILSPYLFSRYIRELLVAIDSTAVGCFIGNHCLNVLANVKSEFTFAICHRPSVCLSSVCNVRAPYSGDWNFRQCFYTIWYAGHLLKSR